MLPSPSSSTLCTMLCSLTVLAAAVLYSSRNGALVQAIPTAESVGSDLRLLFQNDLDCMCIFWHYTLRPVDHRSSPSAGRTTAEHTSTILLSSRTNSAATTACSKLSESLLTTNGTFFSSDTKHLIQYLALNGGAAPSQNYWVSSTDSTSKRACTAVSTKGLSSVDCDQSLPAFCSNSAPNKISGQTDLSPEFQVQVSSGNITFTGYVLGYPLALCFTPRTKDVSLDLMCKCVERAITSPSAF